MIRQLVAFAMLRAGRGSSRGTAPAGGKPTQPRACHRPDIGWIGSPAATLHSLLNDGRLGL